MVTYGVTTQVLSIGSSDQASENVLSTTVPANIIIGAGPGPSGTIIPIPTGSLTPTPITSATPTTVNAATPTTAPGATDTPTPSPTLIPGDTATPSLEPSPTGTGSASVNQPPVCNSLVADRATTGVAPYSITFTVNGTDPDGTISKVNYNFGDGGISGDITTTGGIGTNSVNVATSHTFNNAGQYTTSAILTDNNGGVSSSNSCQQTIIVQAGTGGNGTTTDTGTPTETPTKGPTPTMAATGSFTTSLGIGAVALFLVIGGGLLFFVL